MTSVHAASSLPEPPLSRAGSLPQEVVFQGIDPFCTSIHANNAINILLQLRDHPPQ
jgi:hypothetical protein